MRMKALQIIKCSNSIMWYRDHIGKFVPLLRDFGEEYLSREPSGLTNIVKKGDAIIVDIDPSGVLYLNSRFGDNHE